MTKRSLWLKYVYLVLTFSCLSSQCVWCRAVSDQIYSSEQHSCLAESVCISDSNWTGLPPHPRSQHPAQAGEHDVLHVLLASESSAPINSISFVAHCLS